MINCIDDLFSEIISPSDDIGKQVELQMEYTGKFGHGIPLAYIPKRITKEELLSKIEYCIKTNEDNLLEQLDVHIRSNCIY